MPRRKEPRKPDAVLDQLLAGADPNTVFDANGLIVDGLRQKCLIGLDCRRSAHVGAARPSRVRQTVLVLLPKPDHLLLDNIAVAPEREGSGLGQRLLAFAEAEAMRRGYHEIRLYTHETMIENQRLYAAIGYEETGRGTEATYERVFMRTQLGS
jgi:ribosomal protein S18 acetylase RimI-like enzyme